MQGKSIGPPLLEHLAPLGRYQINSPATIMCASAEVLAEAPGIDKASMQRISQV